MQERTDDQLDDLFRKSAEEFDPPFDPAAWQDMRSRLDAHDRPQTTLYRTLLRWSLLGLLTLLLSIGGWYVYRLNETRQQPVVSAAIRPSTGDKTPLITDAPARADRTTATTRPTETRPTTDVNGAARPKGESAATKPIESKPRGNMTSQARARPAPGQPTESVNRRLVTAQPTTNQPVQSQRMADAAETATNRPGTAPVGTIVRTETTSSTNPVASSSRRRRPVKSAPKPSTRRPSDQPAPISDRATAVSTTGNVKNTGDGTSNVSTIPRQRRTGRPSLDVNPSATALGSSPTAFQNATDSATRLTNDAASLMLDKLPIRPQRWSRPVFRLDRDVTIPFDEELEPRRPRIKPLPTRGLSVRLVTAPDLSAVGLRNFERPGNNLGLLLEYRLASRWSAQVGVMQSAKIYKASVSDYELPGYFRVMPESVSGRCSLLDIPINVRYDFRLQTGAEGQVLNRWFVSGGTTTYVMRQEDYYYNYANPNDPHIYANRREWHGNTGSYNFSQLNLSAGYERALSRRLSWQIEPFVKVPLRGVGYLKIKLLSTGAFFSLRYRL